MGTHASHLQKYQNFKKEAEKSNYIPSKIENYFLAAFHLIDCILANYQIHSDLHKKMFKTLKENPNIFQDKTFMLMDAFRRIERDLRPGITYGSKENGEKLEEVIKLFESIEEICFPLLEGLE